MSERAMWEALEAQLEPVEHAYRRTRVGRFGAEDLSGDDHAAVMERLRACVGLYLVASEPVRDAMRKFFRGTDRLANFLDMIPGEALARIREHPERDGPVATESAQAIERGALEALGAVSLCELGIDFRDTYVQLGELYLALEARGVQAGALFARAGTLSSGGPSRGGSGSTRDFLLGFERSAYFEESVAPRLRRSPSQ